MSRRIRIVHVTYDMGIGGTEQVIKQLIMGLDKAVYDCRVLCLDGQIGHLGMQLQEQGIDVDVLQRQPGLDLSLIMSIRDLIRIHQVDILHCHQYTPYSYGILAALMTNVRVIFTEHGRFHPDRYSWKRRIANPLLNLATEAVTAISEATRQALIRYEWFPARSVSVIYNGISDRTAAIASREDRQSLGLTEELVVFGTIARLDSIKNHRMMIEAFSMVHKQQLKTRLLIVGDGPERDALEQYANTLDVRYAVIFTGFQIDTPRYLTLIDIFLLSSFSEGTSMTLLEAMSCSKPCVATAVGGNVELLEHSVNGLLSKSADVDDFAQCMLSILTDPDMKESLSRNARQTFLEKFEVGFMIDAYQRLYTKN